MVHSTYHALAIATGALSPDHKPDLTNTQPVVKFPPRPGWSKIVSFDPFGANVVDDFADHLSAGVDVRPTIAMTTANLSVPEIQYGAFEGAPQPDGEWMLDTREIRVIEATFDPVWYLPGVADRLGVPVAKLRQCLCAGTGIAEVVERPEIDVFLPPIPGALLYIFGDPELIGKPDTEYTFRHHDQCMGSDAMGSDICTCRPYLVFGLEECVRRAQQGGIGIFLLNGQEARNLGLTTKFAVYNVRKRLPGGDRPEMYFPCTCQVAGVPDLRFPQLIPVDILRWLGITRIHRLISMSPDKRNALLEAGIDVVDYVELPEDRIPHGARVEISAKRNAGYGHTPGRNGVATRQGVKHE
jgi:GTP cyclohydrolase II